MGFGEHGGFGKTKGSRGKSPYTLVWFVGTVSVDGEKCDISRRVYQRHDIDFSLCDVTGRTNLQRMKDGNAPIGNDGRPIHLHHILQKESGPLVEIREVTHTEYHSALHGLIADGDSFRKDKRLARQYANFRKKYWRWRAKQYIDGGCNEQCD